MIFDACKKPILRLKVPAAEGSVVAIAPAVWLTYTIAPIVPDQLLYLTVPILSTVKYPFSFIVPVVTTIPISPSVLLSVSASVLFQRLSDA